MTKIGEQTGDALFVSKVSSINKEACETIHLPVNKSLLLADQIAIAKNLLTNPLFNIVVVVIYKNGIDEPSITELVDAGDKKKTMFILVLEDSDLEQEKITLIKNFCKKGVKFVYPFDWQRISHAMNLLLPN
jgi:hypothetical protein